MRRKRARLLIRAAKAQPPLRVYELARTAGLTHPTAYAVLHNPTLAIRMLLDDSHGNLSRRPRPVLSESARRSLEMVAVAALDSWQVKRARILLLAAEGSGPVRIGQLARIAGVSRQTVNVALRDADACVRDLLAFVSLPDNRVTGRRDGKRNWRRAALAVVRRPLNFKRLLSESDRAALTLLAEYPGAHRITRLRAAAVLAADGIKTSQLRDNKIARQLGVTAVFVRRSLMLFSKQGAAGLDVPRFRRSGANED